MIGHCTDWYIYDSLVIQLCKLFNINVGLTELVKCFGDYIHEHQRLDGALFLAQPKQ